MDLTRGEVLPGHGLGWVGVGVGPMGLMGGTIVVVVMAVQELPVGALLQVLRKGDVVHGPVRAHSSLCTAAHVAQHRPTWAIMQHAYGLAMTRHVKRVPFSCCVGPSPPLGSADTAGRCMAQHQSRSCQTCKSSSCPEEIRYVGKMHTAKS